MALPRECVVALPGERVVALPRVYECVFNSFCTSLRPQILELPEIEKEVKRLLRADEEALSVKWEVLREDEDKAGLGEAGQEVDSRAPANLDGE